MEHRNKKPIKWPWVLLLASLAVSLSILLAFRLVLFNCVVPSSSMLPAIAPGDQLIGLRLAYGRSNAPRRGDIVTFTLPGDETIYTKRVVGLPGDEIFIDKASGQVYRNGEMLKETYVQELSYEPCDTGFPVTVPEGHIFVLGDNREVSVDSRSAQIGMVPLDTLIGRVWSSSRLVD